MQRTDPRFFSERTIALCFWTALAAVLTWGIFSRPSLLRPDEGRYAEIPLAMWRTGEWLVPRLNGFLYFEKPPLQYWWTAGLYSLLGAHPWVAHLPPVMAALFSAWVLHRSAQRMYGPLIAHSALALYVSSAFFVVFSQALNLDMVFSTALSCAVFLTLHSVHTGRVSAVRWLWVAMACAVLTKGPVALVLWMGWWLALVCGARVPFLRAHLPGLVPYASPAALRVWHGPSLVLFAVLTLPWFVWMSATQDGFAHFYFYQQHFQRYTDMAFHRPGAWYYFVLMACLATLPWCFLLLSPSAAGAGASRPAPTDIPTAGALSETPLATLPLMMWVAVVVGFFSFSDSKLPAYILPALPALCLTLALHMQRVRHPWMPALGLGLLYLAGRRPLLKAVAKAGGALELGVQTLHDFSRQLDMAMALWCAAVLCLVWLGRIHRTAWMRAAACTACLAGVWIVTGAERFSGNLSARTLHDTCVAAQGPFDPDARWYTVRQFDHSAAFYFQRTMVMVEVKDELGFGVSKQPERYIPNAAAWAEGWRLDTERGQRAYAIVRVQDILEWQTLGLPYRTVCQVGKRAVIANF